MPAQVGPRTAFERRFRGFDPLRANRGGRPLVVSGARGALPPEEGPQGAGMTSPSS